MTGLAILKRDIVAGLPLYTEAGDYLGVSLGPPVGDHVDTLDETDPADHVKRSTPWRLARIGDNLPG